MVLEGPANAQTVFSGTLAGDVTVRVTGNDPWQVGDRTHIDGTLALASGNMRVNQGAAEGRRERIGFRRLGRIRPRDERPVEEVGHVARHVRESGIGAWRSAETRRGSTLGTARVSR